MPKAVCDTDGLGIDWGVSEVESPFDQDALKIQPRFGFSKLRSFDMPQDLLERLKAIGLRAIVEVALEEGLRCYLEQYTDTFVAFIQDSLGVLEHLPIRQFKAKELDSCWGIGTGLLGSNHAVLRDLGEH